ncbi:hypothetical protein E2C01_035892 [Portunus trituberculatus]|uniref:Uncharacterized protein n=1 Tax=Portunus trituberculatus TaxID=210409 RepID=A0A5B7FAY3_PORTR|nr:hypothetical protein [Portunus trituberculatus]
MGSKHNYVVDIAQYSPHPTVVPVCRPGRRRDFVVGPEGSVNLECGVEAHPTALTYTWAIMNPQCSRSPAQAAWKASQGTTDLPGLGGGSVCSAGPRILWVPKPNLAGSPSTPRDAPNLSRAAGLVITLQRGLQYCASLRSPQATTSDTRCLFMLREHGSTTPTTTTNSCTPAIRPHARPAAALSGNIQRRKLHFPFTKSTTRTAPRGTRGRLAASWRHRSACLCTPQRAVPCLRLSLEAFTNSEKCEGVSRVARNNPRGSDDEQGNVGERNEVMWPSEGEVEDPEHPTGDLLLNLTSTSPEFE